MNNLEIKKLVLKLNKEGKKIGLCHGVFDVLHSGHIHYFNQAKKLGDILVVIVNNDYQRSLKKSKEFMNEEERSIILKELKVVDDVIISIDTDRTVIKSIKYILDQVGFKIIDIEFNEINGGSFALTVAKKDSIHKEEKKIVSWLLAKEKLLKVNELRTFKEFFKKCEKQKKINVK